MIFHRLWRVQKSRVAPDRSGIGSMSCKIKVKYGSFRRKRFFDAFHLLYVL